MNIEIIKEWNNNIFSNKSTNKEILYKIYINGIYIWFCEIFIIHDINSFNKYLWIEYIPDNIPFIYISYITINKEYRSQGYAKLLLEYILNDNASIHNYLLLIRNEVNTDIKNYTNRLISLYSKYWFSINNNIIIDNYFLLEKKY